MTKLQKLCFNVVLLQFSLNCCFHSQYSLLTVLSIIDILTIHNSILHSFSRVPFLNERHAYISSPLYFAIRPFSFFLTLYLFYSTHNHSCKHGSKMTVIFKIWCKKKSLIADGPWFVWKTIIIGFQQNLTTNLIIREIIFVCFDSG